MTKFTFLLVEDSPCGNLKEIAKLCPHDVDLSDGQLLYYWSTEATHVETAVDRAIKQCQKLREKTGLDWEFDDEFRRDSNLVSFHDNKQAADKVQALGLW